MSAPARHSAADAVGRLAGDQQRVNLGAEPMAFHPRRPWPRPARSDEYPDICRLRPKKRIEGSQGRDLRGGTLPAKGT